MIHYNNVINWFDTKAEAVAYALDLGVTQDKAEIMPKSVTFIASKLDDNKKLMESDPNYLANLMALAEVDKERLLNGNWKIKPAAGRYFKRAQANIIETVPDDIIMWCRAWDLAATSEDENGDADYTASVLMGKRRNGRIVILNVTNNRINAGDVEKLVYNVSLADRAIYGFNYIVRIPQDPGQAGKVLAKHYTELLSGFNIKCQTVSGSKELRATPMATQWQHGNIDVLAAEWNDMYFSQLESFPESKHDDMVDAGSDAFNELADFNYNIDNLL